MNDRNYLQNLKSLAFRLTDLCNLNCAFCGQSKQLRTEENKAKKHFLELNELTYIPLAIEDAKKSKN